MKESLNYLWSHAPKFYGAGAAVYAYCLLPANKPLFDSLVSPTAQAAVIFAAGAVSVAVGFVKGATPNAS